MKKYLVGLISLLLLSSCADVAVQGMKPRTVEDYYTPTGVEKYFLTDIPTWANFDQLAKCYRTSNIRYFDIDAIMKSYGLSYNKALQVQASFNEEYAEFKARDVNHVMTLKDEESLFHKVSEKVSSKIIFFDPPTFKRINLVWLDEILGDSKKEKKLKIFLNSKVMDEGTPVLISLCLTRSEVEKRFPEINTKMITAELFSVFDSTGNKTPGFKIELDQFFSSTQKIYFYSQGSSAISENIKGLFKISNY